MKWNKHVKLTATATSALLFALLLASCSNDNHNNNVILPISSPIQQDQVDSPDETNTEVDTQTEEANSNEDQNSAEANQDDTKEPIVQDTTTYEATGKYLGAIDNNSIEVEINGVPTVFILSDAFDYVISDFAENSKITLKYTKDTDGSYVQNVVTAISNAK